MVREWLDLVGVWAFSRVECLDGRDLVGQRFGRAQIW